MRITKPSQLTKSKIIYVSSIKFKHIDKYKIESWVPYKSKLTGNMFIDVINQRFSKAIMEKKSVDDMNVIPNTYNDCMVFDSQVEAEKYAGVKWEYKYLK